MANYEIVKRGEPVRLVRCGDYIAASDGKIYKKNWNKTNRTQEVKQYKDKDGYLIFTFNNKPMRSHRFIAMCFLPNITNLPQVNHKNEIKDDNRVDNLEWCNVNYNINYGMRNEKAANGIKISMIGKHINRPDLSKPVSQFTKSGDFIATYPSTMEAQRQTGCHYQSISNCCNGKQKTAHGFVWRFAE